MTTVHPEPSEPGVAIGEGSLELTPSHFAHLVGVGGAGMSSLAHLLAHYGWRLTASDCSPHAAAAVGSAGVRVQSVHARRNVKPSHDLLIHSDAVGAENEEIQEAERLGIPVCSYFEFVGRLSAARQTLAVAGTHGKSTTTAMAGAILLEAGLDPMVLFGAVPAGGVSGGRGGSGRWMVVEACEYRANFLKLRPQAAAVLGIEPDHFDYYRSPDQLQEAFGRLVQLVPSDGLLVARHDCAATRTAALRAGCRVETFGLDPSADWSATRCHQHRGCYWFQLVHGGRRVAEIRLRVPGRHNVLNAVAAAALASCCGASAEATAAALCGFRGLARRLEPLAPWRGVVRIDDYAHHPTEVAAAVRAVRQMVPEGRLWSVFQPHQASRTAHLLDALAASLDNTDVALVADIYRAREQGARPGEVTAADLAARVRARGVAAPAVHSVRSIAGYLRGALGPGDVLLTMGAGDIGKLHTLLAEPSGEN